MRLGDKQRFVYDAAHEFGPEFLEIAVCINRKSLPQGLRVEGDRVIRGGRGA